MPSFFLRCVLGGDVWTRSGYNHTVRRRFFIEQFGDTTATLRGDAAEHLGRVLRAEPGQLYELSDGERVWLARVESIGMLKRGENRVEFSLVEPVAVRESKVGVDLLIALVKFDRFEWCLEKATELGVRNILPVAAARSEKGLVAAAEKRRERWEKILVESAQQSRRVSAPGLEPIVSAEKAFAAAGDMGGVPDFAFGARRCGDFAERFTGECV